MVDAVQEARPVATGNAVDQAALARQGAADLLECVATGQDFVRLGLDVPKVVDVCRSIP